MVVPLDNVLSARQKEAFKEEERFGSQSDKVHICMDIKNSTTNIPNKEVKNSVYLVKL